MTSLEPYRRALAALPTTYKLAGGVVIVVLVIAIASGVGGVVSKIKDARFDRAEQVRAAERDKQQAVTDAAIKRAEAAEAQLVIAQEEADAQKKLAAELGKTAKEKALEAQRIENETDAAVTAARDLSPDAARAYIRAKLAELQRR